MNKLKIFFLVLIFSFISMIALSEISIVYVSGPCKIDLNGDENWRPAELHMQLNEHSVVKTGEGGAIELDIEGHSIAIGENTTVSLNYIMANVNKRKKVGWFKSFAGLFSREKSEGSTALLGVRGAKAEGEEEEVDWLADESELESTDRLEDAISLYNEERYAEAINIFEDLYKSESSGDKKAEIAFYLGSCYFDGLQYDRASKYLEIAAKDETSQYYEEALLKYGFSEYFQGNYRNAIKSFTRYSNEFGDREIVPYIQLMIGKSYKELGEEDTARRYLRKVMEQYRESDASKEAAKELSE
ncbi:MAG: hypothetical protein DRP54_07800 [Spirochaetes bacterium]|nr:MAG: hypothetical protein DRP54_07800 [Spirochaetota bacterium]